MRRLFILLLVAALLAGCGEKTVDPGDTAKGPKLSAADAEQYRSIIPGGHQSGGK